MPFLLVDAPFTLASFPFEISNLLAGQAKNLRFSAQDATQIFETWEEMGIACPTLPLAAAFFDQQKVPFDALYVYVPTRQEGRVRVVNIYKATKFTNFYPLALCASYIEGHLKGILEFK